MADKKQYELAVKIAGMIDSSLTSSCSLTKKQLKEIAKAAADAGRIRFRPIMMTAMAFVFGVLPMLFATGAGAGSRIALGTAVVFGMAVNAVVGTLFVPNFWELLETFREKHLLKTFNPDATLPTPNKTDGTDDDSDPDSI